MRFPVVNIARRPTLGQYTAVWDTPGSGLDMNLPNTTSIEPYPSQGTTRVSPWDLMTMQQNLHPQMTSEENVQDIYAPRKAQPPPPPPPPPPPNPILENPPGQKSPVPRFISAEEAAAAMNLTGLAVAGGVLVAGIGAGLAFG